MNAPVAIAYIDGPRLLRALDAGIRHLFQRRDYINRINVFPVPDGDTGTNMAFTFSAIQDALSKSTSLSLIEVFDQIAEGALDGARGNSGAIMAQYFQGFRAALGDLQRLTARDFAALSVSGSEQAWTAMSEPVPGTLPTVLEDFAVELQRQADAGITDIVPLLHAGLEAARASLDNTPNLLPALRQAGVVDAGGQGFVDLLEGIVAFLDRGVLDAVAEDLAEASAADIGFDAGDDHHRFCTECVIEGAQLDRSKVMQRLKKLDCSSLMVAGSDRRVRVHIHVDQPAEVFLACEEFGEIAQQKADDMTRQHGLLNHSGKIAVVTDSGADLPDSEIERLGIHLVPVRLSFGNREYLDGVSIGATEFYRMLESGEEWPQTSQPPAGDFRRVYTLLGSHGYDVISVGLSSGLSGTTQAAMSAADRTPEAQVRVIDSLNASAGQGLLTILAAEAAAEGMNSDEIEALLEEMIPQTLTLALPVTLDSAVRGGRVPAWVGRLSALLHLLPVLRAKQGRLSIAGVTLKRANGAKSLARRAVRRMRKDRVYRVLIAHADCAESAHELRRLILAGHSMIHSCHLAEAGPALGVHLGRDGLIVALVPQPRALG